MAISTFCVVFCVLYHISFGEGLEDAGESCNSDDEISAIQVSVGTKSKSEEARSFPIKSQDSWQSLVEEFSKTPASHNIMDSHNITKDHKKLTFQAKVAQGARHEALMEISESERSCYPNCPSLVGQVGEHATGVSGGASCNPTCTWSCEEVKCDEVCQPVCQPPICETRCPAVDIQGCEMECETPQCAVLCPSTGCPLQTCAKCTTSCSEPMCKLQCPQSQPCQNVCQEPACEWKCTAPTVCPAPKCRMLCESPRNCMTNTFRDLPSLKPGELSVQSFAASGLSLEQGSAHLSVKGKVGGPEGSDPSHKHMMVPMAKRSI